MNQKTDGNVHEAQLRESRVSDFSNEELLEEVARRLASASEELKLLRASQTELREKDATQTYGRYLPETVDGLLAMVNVGPRAVDDGTGWDSPDPFTSPKILRKKAIVKLARVGFEWPWTRQDFAMARSTAV